MRRFRRPLRAGLSFLRRHGQATALWTGAVLAIGGAEAWYQKWIGQIRGSLFIGIGSSAIAAALVSYFGPFNEAAYRKFISLGIDRVWPCRQDVDKRDWVDWLQAATSKVVLLGVEHREWCKDQRFPGALRDCVQRGVRIKVLFLNPKCEFARLRAREEKSRDTLDAIRESIAFVWKLRQGLEAGVRNRLDLYVYDAMPSCGLTWIDEFMVVTHYLAGQSNRTAPALRVAPPYIGMGSSLYNMYAENLDAIENTGEEINAKNIDGLCAREEAGPAAIAGSRPPQDADRD
jgi:hypothetical protein